MPRAALERLTTGAKGELVASRQQVRELLDRGLDYTEAGHRLGIPPGQVYLIATGMAADGADAPPDAGTRPGALPASQHLANPPHDNPTTSQPVLDWIAGRVAADQPMREAAARRTAEPDPPRAEDPESAAKKGPTRPHRRAS